MKPQSLKNHAQYVPGFHVVTSLIIISALVISIILLVHDGIHHTTIFYFLVALSLGLLYYYTRSFANGNQDRIIRAEENFRFFRLTGKTMDKQLSAKQLVALRFADDAELQELVKLTIEQNFTPSQIKQQIKVWRPDYARI